MITNPHLILKDKTLESQQLDLNCSLHSDSGRTFVGLIISNCQLIPTLSMLVGLNSSLILNIVCIALCHTVRHIQLFSFVSQVTSCWHTIANSFSLHLRSSEKRVTGRDRSRRTKEKAWEERRKGRE